MRRAGLTLALVAMASGAVAPSACAQADASARAAAPAPAETNRTKRSRPADWELHLGSDVRYDSNVLELSAHDRALVNENNGIPSDRFRLKSVDDVLMRPRLDFGWSKNLLTQRATQVSLGAAPTWYLRNAYLNRERWSASIEQELGRDRRPTMSRIGLALDSTPRTTLRRLKDDDVSLQQGRVVRVDAVYSSWSARLSGAVEVVPRRMAVELALDREWRDYIDTLDERDGVIDAWSVRLVGQPDEGGHWRLRAGYRSERYDGKGDDLATPLTEDDLTSDRDIVSADARLTWGRGAKAQRLSFGLEREARRYLAKSPFDFYHYQRSDERLAWRVGWRRALPRHLAVEVEVAGDGNRSTFAQPVPTVSAGEATDYDVTTVTAGLTWQLGLRGSRASSTKGARSTARAR